MSRRVRITRTVRVQVRTTTRLQRRITFRPQPVYPNLPVSDEPTQLDEPEAEPTGELDEDEEPQQP